jgi:DNA-binding MarR family transcriptional regulator
MNDGDGKRHGRGRDPKSQGHGGASEPPAQTEMFDHDRGEGGRNAEPPQPGMHGFSGHDGNIWGPMRRPAVSSRSDLTTALDAVRRIVRVLRESSARTERELGIGGAQLFVLHQLASAPARSINELADRTYTHQSSVSVVVRRLVEQRLVARRPAAGDARRRELRLTAAGRRLVERAPMPAQVRLIEGLGALEAAELAKLSRLLRRVVGGMGAAAEPPSMLFAERAGGLGSKRRS